jgi:protein TonB
MSAEQLREAATKALSENRIYAPGGDNAMEYYLALRDKLPSDPAVTSALTDLMPYTLIATEQSIGREDFVEAQRLSALLEKADPKAPALPRLKQTIANAQLAVAARAETEKTKEVTAAEAKALEEQRLAQQAEQQRAAAAALATQQQQEAARAAEAERVAAAQREAAQREAAARATPPAATAAAPAAARPAASSSLKVVSSPSPRYPPEALRAGTAGEVLVEITIGTDGSVTNARVVRATPPRVFDREALNAVRRWKFEPIDAPTTTRRTLAFNPG